MLHIEGQEILEKVTEEPISINKSKVCYAHVCGVIGE